MVAKSRWIRAMVCGVALALVAQAGSLPGQGTVFNRGYPNAPCCHPNMRDFGYFATQWSQWPEAPRQDQVLPQSIGADRLPTPAAEPVAPPAAADGDADHREEIKRSEPLESGTPGLKAAPAPSLLPGSDAHVPGVSDLGPAIQGLSLPPASAAKSPATPSTPAEPAAKPPALETPSVLQMPPSTQKPAALPTLPVPQTPATPQTPPSSQTPPSPDDMPPPNAAPARSTRQPAAGGFDDDSREAVKPFAAAFRDPPNQNILRSNFGAMDSISVEQSPLRKADSVSEENGAEPSARQAGYDEPAASQPSLNDGEVSVRFQGASDQSFRRSQAAHPYQQVSAEVEVPTELAEQNAPTALEGYCPVASLASERWTAGDSRWSVVHQGRTYRMSGPEQRQAFLANPARYLPVLGGLDPVLAMRDSRQVPGRLEFSMLYEGRIYMFASQASLADFREDPKAYAVFGQAAK
jgi:YHS domain-containing protein